MRVLVLWIRCFGISAEEDARWAEEESARLRACDGVLDLTLYRIEDATVHHAREWDWCLELQVANGAANAAVRHPVCAEFLADLRLLGTRPTVLVLPEAS